MEQVIMQYVENKNKIKLNNKNISNKIYNFLIDNIIINIDDTIIFNDMLIYKNLKFPEIFEESHPDTEYSYSFNIENNIITICLGIDWFGIRRCGDEYCYYIVINV